LKVGATFSKWRVRVTPSHCTQCRLCEASCPLGALREPRTAETDPLNLQTDRRRLTQLVLALPILIAAGVFVGEKFSGAAATVHPTVALAQRWVAEQNTKPKIGALSPEDLALERARQNPEALLATAQSIRGKVRVGSWIFGGWIGLVIGLKLISLAMHRPRTDFEPGAGECFGCARCFEFCPDELARRGVPIPLAGMRQSSPVPASSQIAEVRT